MPCPLMMMMIVVIVLLLLLTLLVVMLLLLATIAMLIRCVPMLFLALATFTLLPCARASCMRSRAARR